MRILKRAVADEDGLGLWKKFQARLGGGFDDSGVGDQCANRKCRVAFVNYPIGFQHDAPWLEVSAGRLQFFLNQFLQAGGSYGVNPRGHPASSMGVLPK